MNSAKKKAYLIFSIASIALAALFFLFPINLFDSVIVVDRGLQHFEQTVPLSLSYYIGFNATEIAESGIVDFYLTTKGWILAFIFIFGIPGVLAYRIYLKSSASKQ